MRILVTGSSGFLGTALCAHLERRRHQVVRLTSANCDLTQPRNLQKFSGAPYDQIYHLAAWTQAGDFCLRHPGEQWIINQQINTNVLSWWQRCQPQAKLICMGTSCAYAPGGDLKEEAYMRGEPIESLLTYALTKRMLYAGLLALQRQFGLRYLCAVPSTLYGPGYHTDGRQMHFIFDVIRKIIRGKELQEPVVLWGDGRQKRELVYLADFVDALCRLARSQDNDLINIGSGQEFSIRQFARQICAIVGYPVRKIQYDRDRYVGAQSKCLNPEKFDSILPGFRFTPLHLGLERTIRWFYQSRAYLAPVAPDAASR